MRSEEVDRLLDEAVADQVFPGGQLLVADRGRVVHERSFGRLSRVPEPGAPVTPETIYDVASLTKVVATTSLVMRLIEAGRLSLDMPAAAIVPELPHPRITVRHLLAHASGLPAWRPFYERSFEGDRRLALLRFACTEGVEADPNERSVYSDLGFIILGAVVERTGGERLDALAARAVLQPLGMSSSGFVDLDASPRRTFPGPVAPTEVCPRRGLVRAEVHDDNCHAAGGIMGHAGLFSCARDLSRFAAALCASFHGERVPGGFPPELVHEFFQSCRVPASTRRLGWDGPGPEPGMSSAGDLWPKDGVGHLGFTGCSLWMDPPRSRWVVLLTNRVHPSRADERIKLLRPKVHDAITRALAA